MRWGGKDPLAVADRITRALGKPLVHTVHSWLLEDRVRQLPSGICGVVAVNQDIREHLVNAMNVPKGLIRVIPYGVEEPTPIEAGPRAERRVPVVGTVGRLEKGRRLEEFLEVAHLVRQELDEVLFMVAGEGPDEVRLRQATKALGLEDVVTFATPRAGVEHVYRASDVMVLVSDWGGDRDPPPRGDGARASGGRHRLGRSALDPRRVRNLHSRPLRRSTRPREGGGRADPGPRAAPRPRIPRTAVRARALPAEDGDQSVGGLLS